jgi:hypothetical protein
VAIGSGFSGVPDRTKEMTVISISPPSIALVRFADPLSRVLKTESQAERVIAALRRCSRCSVELDFSGIAGTSPVFCDAFFGLAERELPDTWLVPRHYEYPWPSLVHRLVGRLACLREKNWIRGVESLVTGFGSVPRLYDSVSVQNGAQCVVLAFEPLAGPGRTSPSSFEL